MQNVSSIGPTQNPSLLTGGSRRLDAAAIASGAAAAQRAARRAQHKPPSQHSEHQQQYGFSLLELLVVLFVVIMVTSMVSLSVGSGSSDVQLETMVRELADSAAYALDEAQFTGQDYGLQLDQSFDTTGTLFNYRWLERRIDGWNVPETGKEIFAQREMPGGIVLELEIENSPFSEVDVDATEEDEEEALRPQIVFYASGETTVGAINVRRAEDSELLWRIEWDLLGRFQVLRNGIPAEDE